MSTGSRLSNRTLSLFCAVSLCFTGNQCVRSGEAEAHRQTSSEAAMEIQQLMDRWAGWKEQTKTSRIEGFRFIGLCSTKESAIARDAVLKMYTEVLMPWCHSRIVASDPVTIESLADLPVEAMFPRLPKGALKYDRVGTGWSHFVLLDSPSGRRVDQDASAGHKTIVRRDGKEQKYSSATKQASLLPGEGKERVEKLADFLYMPNLRPLTDVKFDAVDRYVFTNTSKDHEFKIEVNPANGFVYHDARRLTERGYLIERIQDLPFDGAGVLPIPRLLVQMSYQSATPSGPTFLRSIVFYIITSVELNNDTTPQDLQLAVPAGTVIADFENQMPSPTSRTGMGPTARRVMEPVKDALEKAREPAFRGGRPVPAANSAPPAPSGLKNLRWYLILLNALLLGAVIVGWRRNSK